MNKKLTDYQKIEIVEKYQTGDFTCSELGKEYSVYGSTINSMLRNRGIEINNDRSQLNRLYTLNDYYFDEIDTEYKAYWLGWLYSDGNNYPPNKTISITLQEDDREILEKFRFQIESNRPIEYISNLNKKDGCIRKPQNKVSICSEHMSDRLIELGCPQAKSLILKFPTEDQVPKHLLRHWLRGMWDGDGTFCHWAGESKAKNGKIYKQFNVESSIVGTKHICEGIRDFIFEQTNIKTRVKDIKNKEVKRLKNTDRQTVYDFMIWLYSDSTIYLQRKYDKCKEIEQILINKFSFENTPYFTNSYI